MRVYISGKITGDDNYYQKFEIAQSCFERLGDDVFNPAEISASLPVLSHDEYMEIDRVCLQMCDAIYMLSDYRDSPGALEELEIAKSMGLKIMYESRELL